MENLINEFDMKMTLQTLRRDADEDLMSIIYHNFNSNIFNLNLMYCNNSIQFEYLSSNR